MATKVRNFEMDVREKNTRSFRNEEKIIFTLLIDLTQKKWEIEVTFSSVLLGFCSNSPKAFISHMAFE